MLSRLALRAGAFGPALRQLQSNGGVTFVAVRQSSTAVDQTKAQDPMTIVNMWKQVNSTYYGPERDLKNFPHPAQPETHPPVRMLMIPESFFNAFYNKTGVTGPYMLMFGGLIFALSKEHWVMNHNFTEVVTFSLLMGIFINKLGKPFANFLDEKVDRIEDKYWYKPMTKAKADCQETIKQTETAIWQQKGMDYLFEAKKEMVDLQLEAHYRSRLAEAHNAIKKRLDYQLEKENVVRRLQQQHMTSWIVDSVVKSITPQQEKESLKKCIADLKGIAARQ